MIPPEIPADTSLNTSLPSAASDIQARWHGYSMGEAIWGRPCRFAIYLSGPMWMRKMARQQVSLVPSWWGWGLWFLYLGSEKYPDPGTKIDNPGSLYIGLGVGWSCIGRNFRPQFRYGCLRDKPMTRGSGLTLPLSISKFSAYPFVKNGNICWIIGHKQI